MKVKVIIAGGREFDDYQKLCEVCDQLLQNHKEDIEIVSGKARGADSLGERYAREKGYHIKEFPADWDTYGKSAGYRRNEEMAFYGDLLIAFWDQKSKGTENMIKIAKDHHLVVRIAIY